MLKKLKIQINHFIENIKRENKERPSGWHQRVESIYIYFYKLQVNANGHHSEPGRK